MLDPYSLGGLPHSATSGSWDMCSSPELFAACHGLLRRAAPRHPPYALSRLTILFFTLSRMITYLLLTLYLSCFARCVRRSHTSSLSLCLPFPVYCQRTCSEVLSTLGHLLEIVGLEPATYGLQSHRSSQLSYIPITWCMSFLDTS